MATAPAPVKTDKNDKPAAKQSLVPPDEQFWQRYSPHHELPLSSIGSFALHVLGFGLLALMALLGTYLFSNANRSLPVEAVRLDLGGGGGNPHGKGDGTNSGGAPVEEGAANDTNQENVPSEDTNTPKKINVDPTPKLNPQFNSASQRYIQERDTAATKAFSRLGNVSSKIRISDGPGFGKGGTGKGGGSGDGEGTGIGKGKGPGQENLTQREKRMLRWSMLFNTSSGENYVAQLNGLGAILAIPIKEEGEPEFRVVKNLKGRPPELLDEDISKIQRIYWIDENPKSVADVMNVLHLKLRPSRFIAFMPEELEKKLFELEAAYLKRNYGSKTEDDIVETKFKINVRGGKYEPDVTGMRVK